MGEMKSVCHILMENHLGKCSLGRLRRWEDNIHMDLREIGCDNQMWNWLRIMPSVWIWCFLVQLPHTSHF